MAMHHNHPTESGLRALRGKALVITGGGRGLGAAYCRHAASLGASVLVNDIDFETARGVAASITGAGGIAIPNGMSVATWEGARAIVAECVNQFGAIDGLVNNAGVIHVSSPWEEEERDVAAMVEVNILGTLYCGIHAMRHMIRGRGGSIVNITSGAQSGAEMMAGYAATKGAVASLTYSWALDLLSRGVRANALAPSAATRMIAYARKCGAQIKGHDHPPEDAAPIVSFLLSDASSNITGQVFRFRDASLSVMTRPETVPPLVWRSRWTMEAVTSIFDGELRSRMQPLTRRELNLPSP